MCGKCADAHEKFHEPRERSKISTRGNRMQEKGQTKIIENTNKAAGSLNDY